MNNFDKTQSSKQSLQEVLLGEEPTEEFLEELRVLEESEEISENELIKLALATQADAIDHKVKPVEPNYKTSETNILGVIIIVAILLATAYFLFIYF